VPARRFVLVDVFTDRPLAGNPLPVVLEAAGLTDGQMQAIAREFNASETTFVLPPTTSRASKRLRCFSPTEEVFGAGHNALGAWWVIVAHGEVAVPGDETRLWQEIGSEVLSVDITRAGGTLVRVSMTQSEPVTAAGAPDRVALAAALGLDAAALEVPGLPPAITSTGAMHMLVPIRGLRDLERVRIDAPRLVAIAKPLGCEGCYLFCLETRDTDSTAHARGFFPGIGIAEDPATGTAAGPLAAYLVARRQAAEGTWLTIEQGDEIGRPCRIGVRVSGLRVEVAGRCAEVAEGSLAV